LIRAFLRRSTCVVDACVHVHSESDATALRCSGLRHPRVGSKRVQFTSGGSTDGPFCTTSTAREQIGVAAHPHFQVSSFPGERRATKRSGLAKKLQLHHRTRGHVHLFPKFRSRPWLLSPQRLTTHLIRWKGIDSRTGRSYAQSRPRCSS
jgi:hypothetical protein